MAEWVQLVIGLATVVFSVGGSVAAVSFKSGSRLTKLDAAIEANAKAIGDLTQAQAQSNRRYETDRTTNATRADEMRRELEGRIDRQSARMGKDEAALADLVATVREGFAEIKATLRERDTAPTKPHRSLIDELRDLMELNKLLKVGA